MQAWTQQTVGNDALDAGRTVDAAHARNGDSGRVLIVDDDASVRLVCAVNLAAEGLHVLGNTQTAERAQSRAFSARRVWANG